MLSLTESMRPLASTVILFALMLTWAKFSSYDIIQKHPRIFFSTTGTVFSNIAVSEFVSFKQCQCIKPVFLNSFCGKLTKFSVNLLCAFVFLRPTSIICVSNYTFELAFCLCLYLWIMLVSFWIFVEKLLHNVYY